MKKRMTCLTPLALVVSCLLGAAPAALADEGDIAVGGEFLFRIRAAASGQSVKQRADTVTERLVDILADQTLTTSDVHLVPQKDKTVRMMVKERLLVTVTPDDGKPNQKTAVQQAQIWASRVRIVLPQVNAKTNPSSRKGP